MNDNIIKISINDDNNKNEEIKKNEQMINHLFEKHNLTIKNDILFFKEDLLRELKDLKQDIYSKCNHISIDLQEKIQEMTLKNNELNQKIEYISKIIETKINSSDDENNINKYEEIKKEIKSEIVSNKIQIEEFKDEFKEHKEQFDNLIKNNILYKGLIGSGCKYKNMHEFIDYIILNIDNLNYFKDHKNYDYKIYKNKLDNTLDKISNQTNNIIETSKLYIVQNLKQLEEKIYNEIKLCNSKLMELRVENNDYSKNIQIKLNEEYNKIISIRNNMDDIVEKTINEVNNKAIKLFNNYQKELKSIKNHFNALSELLKDKNLRTYLSNIYKKDIFEMANKIGFDNNDIKLKRPESALLNFSSVQKKIEMNIKQKKDILENEDKNISIEVNEKNIQEKNKYNEEDNVDKNISKSPKKIDEKIGDNEFISMNNENEYINSIGFKNYSQKNKSKIRKVLKNEKLEKYNFLYDNNKNDNNYNNKYPQFCVKNYNNDNNTNNEKSVVYINGKNQKRINSPFPELKIHLLDLNKVLKKNNSFTKENNNNEIRNYISKEPCENCGYSQYNKKYEENNYINNMKQNAFLQGINNNIKYERNNDSLNKIQINKNNNSLALPKCFKNSNENCVQSYTNRNNFNQEKKNMILKTSKIYKNISENNPNKSMENIQIKENENELFYKNISNKKLKIKNLVSIK